ncbi:MAG: HPr family phosphocarrier protein [Butyricicoccaceae bacterium]
MKTFECTITDELGIHARPAGMLVKEASKFASKIMIASPKKEVDAKRIMWRGMSMGVGRRATIRKASPSRARTRRRLPLLSKNSFRITCKHGLLASCGR